MPWTVPNIWEDGECYIIGGGTSIIQQFHIPQDVVDRVYKGVEHISAYSPHLSFLHDKHVIAVNEAYKIGPWIDVLFFGDDSYGQRNRKDILSFDGLRVSCTNTPIEGVKHLLKHKTKRTGITTHPKNTVSWGFNSGAAAINFAIHTGVKKIYLLGFDMYLDAAQNQHWHKSYHSNPKTVRGTFKRHMVGFPVIKADADKLGVEIINLNPLSGIECFPKMNLKDVR